MTGLGKYLAAGSSSVPHPNPPVRPDHRQIVCRILALLGMYTADIGRAEARGWDTRTDRARASAFRTSLAVILDHTHETLDEVIAQATVGIAPETWDAQYGTTFAAAVIEHLEALDLVDPDPITVARAQYRATRAAYLDTAEPEPVAEYLARFAAAVDEARNQPPLLNPNSGER